jgi:anti-sigma regulatory factor (Ser/Thr protein kinase)
VKETDNKSSIRTEDSAIIDHRYVFLSGHLANLISPLPSFSVLAKLGLLSEEELKKLELALDEALANAVDHGNLELDSKLREELDEEGKDKFSSLREYRLGDNQFASRFVYVNVKADKLGVEVCVTDEGAGFDASSENTNFLETDIELPKCSGRGLLLIKAASDRVQFNEKGNELTFYKQFLVDLSKT